MRRRIRLRTTRGNFSRGPEERLDGREAMASLLAARRKDSASTLGLHACAKAVGLVTAAHIGLKGAFRQRWLPPGPATLLMWSRP